MHHTGSYIVSKHQLYPPPLRGYSLRLCRASTIGEALHVMAVCQTAFGIHGCLNCLQFGRFAKAIVRPETASSVRSPLQNKVRITYSTITLVNPSPWSVLAKTTSSLVNTTCLNNRTLNYLTEKAEFSLPVLPILHDNFEASDALLRRSTYLILH